MKQLFCFIMSALTMLGASLSAEQTLTIIKPDAVKANHIGEIISYYEKGNLKVVAIKMVHLTKEQAKEFYGVHKERESSRTSKFFRFITFSS